MKIQLFYLIYLNRFNIKGDYGANPMVPEIEAETAIFSGTIDQSGAALSALAPNKLALFDFILANETIGF